MLRKKIRDPVGTPEAAGFIKGNGEGTVAGARLQDGIPRPVFFRKKADQRLSIALPLKIRFHSQAFDFQNAVPLVRDHTFGFHAALLQHVHGSPFQIAVDHILLLIGKEQQGKIFLFVSQDLSDFHFLLIPFPEFLREISVSLLYCAQSLYHAGEAFAIRLRFFCSCLCFLHRRSAILVCSSAVCLRFVCRLHEILLLPACGSFAIRPQESTGAVFGRLKRRSEA